MGKSSYLLFQGNEQSSSRFQIVLNSIEIPRVRHAKFLGTWIDDRLSWEMHANKILTKIKCGLGMLRQSKNLLTSKAKRLLYFGQIHSHLCYCLVVWGSMLSKQLITKLTNVQHKAVALIDPSKKIEELFRRYKILKVTDLIHLELCKLGYKLCHDLLPKKLAENIRKDHNQVSIEKTHKYATRRKKIPNLPQAAGAKYRSSFLYNCIKAYGEVDSTIRQAKNLSVFVKSCILRYLSD